MKLYTLLFFTLFSTVLYSQNRKGISISPYYAPGVTKTNIYNFLEVTGHPLLPLYYNSKAANLPTYGYSTGLMVDFPIKRKLAFSFGLNYSEKGQQSPRFENFRGGQSYYRFWVSSLEVPIGLTFKIKEESKWKFNSYGAISPDIYLRFSAEGYSKNIDTGNWGLTSWEDLLFHPQWWKPKNIWRRISKKLVRIGFITGVRGEYELTPKFSVFAQPELRYYTDIILKGPYSTLTKGNAYSFNIKLGASINLKSKKRRKR